MCIPTTQPQIGGAGLGLQIGAAILGSYADYRQSKANKAAYSAQTAVERNRATVAEMQARDALNRGQQAAFSSGLKTSQLEGRQRAMLAARGIDLNEGSALNILLDTKYMGGLDQATITDNANKEAWALRETASSDRANAAILSGRASAENPILAGTTGLIRGAGSIADSWYKWKGSQKSPDPTATGDW